MLSLKIALLGYGKMNHLIERLAVAQGHTIVLKINAKNTADFNPNNLAAADVAIDFSTPETAFYNLGFCIQNNLPVVVGTTGWLDKLAEAEQLVKQQQGSLFYAANFSLGVNIFLKINELLAKLLKQNPNYNISLTEIHHTTKLDKPSGTAIELAKNWIEKPSRFEHWSLENPNADNLLTIEALRENNVVGTHILKAISPIDSIEISHIAQSREGFAQGALAAAVWLIGKKGIFSMNDLLESEILRK
jgi:4-hydroxy-tetrahydrodipicolinate reductase